ncbi:hypothetical protein CVT26_007655, partial [Gymnopilus dilepis]
PRAVDDQEAGVDKNFLVSWCIASDSGLTKSSSPASLYPHAPLFSNPNVTSQLVYGMPPLTLPPFPAVHGRFQPIPSKLALNDFQHDVLANMADSDVISTCGVHASIGSCSFPSTSLNGYPHQIRTSCTYLPLPPPKFDVHTKLGNSLQKERDACDDAALASSARCY